jgi:Spy/CpxP family protein refolding chaperone
MIRLKLLMAIFFFLFIHPLPSFSQPSEMRIHPRMQGRPWRGEGPCWRASDLNLSLDQTKRLELIQQAYQRETQNLRTELISKRFEVRESLTNPTVKTESIRPKWLEVNELQSRLNEKAMEYLIKVRNLLTPEQLKIWCPEQEFPLFRRMMQDFGPMGPPHPNRPPFLEGPKEE